MSLTADKITKDMVSIHTLNNGITVMGISAHGFVFSDGSRCMRQSQEIVDSLTLQRRFSLIKHISNMAVNEIAMHLSDEQQKILQKLEQFADIIIVPFPVLVALREQNIRHLFGKCLAFNCTPDTQRLAPSEKVVDISNWSW